MFVHDMTTCLSLIWFVVKYNCKILGINLRLRDLQLNLVRHEISSLGRSKDCCACI